MKSLLEALKDITPIFESAYDQALNKVNFLDEIDAIAGIKKDQYINIIIDRLGVSDDDIKTLAGKAFDMWISDFDQDVVMVPFRFNKEGQVKLQRKYYKLLDFDDGEGNKSKVISGIKIELGTGSIKSLNALVQTADQELATCYVWNALANMQADESGYPQISAEEIKKIVSGINDKFPKAWINSFGSQVMALYKFLKEHFEVSDPSEYRAVRYGETIKYDGEDYKYEYSLGVDYARFVELYKSACASKGMGGIGKELFGNMKMKDSYDPSDIIIFKVSKHDEIARILNDLCDEGADPNKVHAEFIEKLYSKKLLMGISLKKVGKNAHIQEFNTPESRTDISIEETIAEISPSGNSCVVTCTGSFELQGVGNEQVTKSASQIVLELRSFGDYWGCDCKELIAGKKSIALGKVPVNLVSDYIGVKDHSKKSLQKAIEAMMKLGNTNDKKSLDNFQNMISAGIKSGPWCLPFVLIH